MKIILPCALLVVLGTTFAQSTDRPKITGIDHVDFYTSSAEANEHLYTIVLGMPSAPPLEPGQTQRFMVGSQWVGYSPMPDAQATNRMDHLAFRTDDCEALRLYLAAKGIKVPDSVSKLKEGTLSLMVKDPEGNAIEFMQPSRAGLIKIYRAEDMGKIVKPDPISRRIIHVGFIVHDRDAEDHFYRDLLGFHIYWHGGMQPDKTDWVAMQVPDGTDWLEYMLNIKPNADLHTTGVMNHVSIGVVDMKQAQAKLESHGWKAHGDEHAQMGKDGKWQLNVYDPDSTRIELMEFKPTQKPCCSEFQGPHPSEP